MKIIAVIIFVFYEMINQLARFAGILQASCDGRPEREQHKSGDASENKKLSRPASQTETDRMPTSKQAGPHHATRTRPSKNASCISMVLAQTRATLTTSYVVLHHTTCLLILTSFKNRSASQHILHIKTKS